MDRTVSYSVGDKVEVIGREEGLIGSYYEATVVSVLDNGRYEIEYENLIEDEETEIPLREKLLPKDLRPRPPRVPMSEFKMYQVVDVFANDGWWAGRIAGDLDAERSAQYVYFSTPKNEFIEYHTSLFRVHHSFYYGEWVMSPVPRDRTNVLGDRISLG